MIVQNLLSLASGNRDVAYIGNALAVSTLCYALYRVLRNTSALRTEDNGFPVKHGYPILGSLDFLYNKRGFLLKNLERFGGEFVFYVYKSKFYVMKSDSSLHTLFTNRSLDLNAAFKAFGTSGPDALHLTDEEALRNSWAEINDFVKRYNLCTNSERLIRWIPQAIEGLDSLMHSWSPDGHIDPFKDVALLAFYNLTRAFSFKEIAESPDLLRQVFQLSTTASENITPMDLMLPWLPSKLRKDRTEAADKLNETFKRLYNERVSQGKAVDDAVQILMDKGTDMDTIVFFEVGALFAGSVSTELVLAWVLITLSVSPEHKQRVICEMESVVTKYNDSTSNSSSLSHKLSQIPQNAWEEELPFFDLCLKETMRFVFQTLIFRRVMTDGVEVNGRKLEVGSYVVWPTDVTQMDPEIFPEPSKWDPTRLERGEDKKSPYAFAAWGSGYHACPGQRFAKLNIKLVSSLFLLGYNFSLEDKAGKILTTTPEVDRFSYDSSNLMRRPIEPVYIKYERVTP